MSEPSQTLEQLVELMDLEQLEATLFRGNNGPGTHVFGGQVLGQAIVAAARTVVSERALHSLHGYFLRPGDHSRPIVYDVDPIRDGRSFTTRRVVGIQKGRAIFNLSASFQKTEAGVEHSARAPSTPDPETLPSEREHYQQLVDDDPRLRRFAYRYDLIDSRQVEGIHMMPRDAAPARAPRKNTWMKIAGVLPDDSRLHWALLAYISDMDFMSTCLLPHSPALATHRFRGASLDHAMWFHRPFRADEWLLFAKESPSASAGRGLVRGSFYDRSGQLVVSVAQECLMRVIEDTEDTH